MKKDWYCPGYGAPHYVPNGGRLWLVCSRCRWDPKYHDPPEKKAQLLNRKKGKNDAPPSL